MRRICVPAMILALALVAAACGSDDPGPSGDAVPSPSAGGFDQPFAGKQAYPVFASSEIVVGKNRLLVGILNEDDAPIGSPKLEVHISFFDLRASEEEPVAEARMDYLETVPGARGLYVTHAKFSHPGRWGAEVTMTGDGIDETVRTALDVTKKGTTPPVGAQAPRSKTPTLGDAPLDEISSDHRPDRSFYRLSVAEAVTSGRPSVIVFATPEFCSSAVCGPTLDIVKKIARGVSNVNFVHVEVYSNLDDPANLKLVPAVQEWGLPSEPWVFVVDAQGRITAKFEGSVGAQELKGSLRS